MPLVSRGYVSVGAMDANAPTDSKERPIDTSHLHPQFKRKVEYLQIEPTV